MKIILRGQGCNKSATLIGTHLSLPVKRYPEYNDVVVVRWGTSRHAREGAQGTINPREAIYQAANKFVAFDLLAENEITVPKVWSNMDSEIRYPCLSRVRHHRQGRDIRLVSNSEEADLALREDRMLVELLSPINEYRVHVINGEPVRIFRKVKLVEDADELIRTSRYGWGFYRVAFDGWLRPMLTKAVKSTEVLGLIVAALDIIHTTDHRFVVLEANTAPSIVDNTSTRNLYLEAIHNWVSERYEI